MTEQSLHRRYDSLYASRAIKWQAIGGTDSPYTGNWSSFQAGILPWTPAYTKDGMGFVHLRGLVANSVSWPIATIFTLPVGFYPERDEYFSTACWNNSIYGSAVVHTTANAGAVTLAGTTIAFAANDWVSLSGISWWCPTV